MVGFPGKPQGVSAGLALHPQDVVEDASVVDEWVVAVTFVVGSSVVGSFVVGSFVVAPSQVQGPKPLASALQTCAPVAPLGHAQSELMPGTQTPAGSVSDALTCVVLEPELPLDSVSVACPSIGFEEQAGRVATRRMGKEVQ